MKQKFNAPLDVAQIELKVAQYLLDNPQPSDLQFHSFCAGIGVDKDTVEEVSYNMLATVLRTLAHWNLLEHDSEVMDRYLYMTGVDVGSATSDIQSASGGNLSTNMIELLLRARKADELNRIIDSRSRVLSSGESIDFDADVSRKIDDRVQVNDGNRISAINSALEDLGLGQTHIDKALRLLDLDGFVNESALLNTSYNSLREALVGNTSDVFGDPDFDELAKLLAPAVRDDRSLGAQIRISKVRDSARLMRNLTAKYGVANRGLFSGIGSRN